MKCPHCLVEFHTEWTEGTIGPDCDSAAWMHRSCVCPSCKRRTILLTHNPVGGQGQQLDRMIYPKQVSRASFPTDVPKQFASDYKEAAIVSPDSPKASAALSRRCLQHLLREVAEVKHSTLHNEIQEVLDNKTLPPHLADDLDAVRAIGNFAAHPIKSTNTGEIVEVEDGEAERSLDTLDGLFDFWFTQPAASKKKRDALNQKLQDVGKPPLKQSDSAP